MAIQIKSVTENKCYEVPPPQKSSGLDRFVKNVIDSVKGIFQTKNKPLTSFAKSIEAFSLNQEAVAKLKARFDPEKDLLQNAIYASRRTNVDQALLKKIATCIRYLEVNAKPTQDSELFQRYKISEVSFTLHWKERKLASFILHLKKQKREDYKSSGTFSKVSKAVEFFPGNTNTFRFLAESCNGLEEKARPSWIDYKHENVLRQAFYPSYSYKGSRVQLPLNGATSREKTMVSKNVAFTEFFEIDLKDLLHNSHIQSEKFLLNILIKIAHGLEAIHKHHPYRDLKLENIMITLNESLNKISALKIIDLACQHHPVAEDSWSGTEEYWPPHGEEETPKEKQERPSDIYAFGVVCEKLKANAKNITLSDKYEKLITSCKVAEPEKRPLIADVIKQLHEMLNSQSA